MNTRLVWVLSIVVLTVGGVAWLSAKPLARQPIASLAPAVLRPNATLPRQPVRTVFPPAVMQATTTPTIGTVAATPNLIVVNTPTSVRVTVQATDPSLIPGSVNLLRLVATGTQPTILGVMHDDGLNGDATANDKTFSLQVNFNEAVAGQIQLQASAAFRGGLRRAVSNMTSIPIWNQVTDPTTGTLIRFPPTWSSTQEQVNQTALYTPDTVALVAGGDLETPPDIVFTILDNPSSLPLSAFLFTYRGGWFASYKTQSITSISGHPAILLDDTAADLPSEPQLAAFVSVGTRVMIIAAPSDDQGSFMTILSALTIP